MKRLLATVRALCVLLAVTIGLFMPVATLAVDDPGTSGNQSVKYDGFGDFLMKEADQIYITIDIFLTIVVAAYFFFLIMRMADPGEKRVVGLILSLFILSTLLPADNWLINLLTETIFGETKVLGPDAIKNNTYNTDKPTNEVIQQVLLAIQLLGKIFIIFNMFYFAALARGVKQGGGVLAFIGLLAGVVLYNIQYFLGWLKNIGGTIGNVLNALFNA